MGKRSWTLALFAIPAAAARANGAMGLALELWDPVNWTVYVAATVVLEAWLIGRWLKFGWAKSLGASVLANAVTGIGCGLGGCFAPLLHYPLVGSVANPNPFLSAVALLCVFAIPSALIETFVWAVFSRRMYEPVGQHSLLRQVAFAHLVGVPVALAILLAPARPYRGMEILAGYARRSQLRSFARDLENYIGEHEHWPNANSVEELLLKVPPQSDARGPSDRSVLFYQPEFRRFDLREGKRHPWILDGSLAGAKVDFDLPRDDPHYVWYLRPPGDGSWGIQVEPRTGEVVFAN